MNNKTIIEFGLRRIPELFRPRSEADNIDLALNNSGYPAQPHPIIVNNCTPLNQSDCSNFVMYGNFERKL